MLTVMPPIAKLAGAGDHHFLSGYAKVAGTEGRSGVEPEFSTCFGAPFLPRPPAEYGNLLRDYIAKHKVDCWLVNSGWTGGIYGVGRRMPIKVTRALVTSTSTAVCAMRTTALILISVSVPTSVRHRAASAVSNEDLEGQAAFDDTAQTGRDVQKNFAKYEQHVDADVRAATPVRIAAE
jgi:phosphoenolpyruvate carboxykinase (ATP)